MFGSIGAAIASAAGNLIGDTLGSGLNFLGSKNLQEDSQSWQRHILQNQKQWQVDDLLKAGLNPVLATGLNPAMPSGGTANFTGASFDGLRDSMASIRRMETQIAKENLKTAEASAESASAKALSDRIDADLKKDFWVNMGPNSRRMFYGQQMMGGSTAGQIAGAIGGMLNAAENAGAESNNVKMTPLQQKYANGEKLTDSELNQLRSETKGNSRLQQAIDALRNFKIAW